RWLRLRRGHGAGARSQESSGRGAAVVGAQELADARADTARAGASGFAAGSGGALPVPPRGRPRSTPARPRLKPSARNKNANGAGFGSKGIADQGQSTDSSILQIR